MCLTDDVSNCSGIQSSLDTLQELCIFLMPIFTIFWKRHRLQLLEITLKILHSNLQGVGSHA